MFWNIVIGLASFAIQIILTPKPQNAKPAALDEFSVPTAEEGIEIPVLFGTRPLKAPNVIWHGHLKVDAIKGKRRYGLFGPKQVIGHKYSLGMHMGLCHSTIDAIYKIRAGDKIAWQGIRKGGRITIDKPGLFGGQDREGGIAGDVDIELGSPSQIANDYLVSVLGADNVPGHRGITGAVLRRVYVGTTPYLKPWEFTAQRVYKRSDGTRQWYSEKAGIGEVTIEDAAVYIALDVSSSMDGAKLANMKSAVAASLTMLRDIGVKDVDFRLVAWGGVVASSIERRAITADGFNNLISWVNGLSTVGGTDFGAAVSQAGAFYAASGTKRRIMLFVTDGEPFPLTSVDDAVATMAGISDVEVYGFNIDLTDVNYTAQLDNTPDDGVPVVSGGDPQSLQDALSFAFSANIDMNPTHIIRECLTDRAWGMGDGEGDVDQISFMAAADTFFAEGFGLSPLWARESEIEEFVQMVQAHVDAYVYTSRTTGKWVIKPIRADYDIDTIPVIDEDDVTNWNEIVRRPIDEAVNTVVVRYFDRSTGKDASHTVVNVAAVQQAGKVISVTRDYPAICKRSLAQRVGERDLKSLGAGMISGRITCKRTVEGLNPGDPFRLVSARHKLTGEVMRVADIKFGDGRANAITIQFAQDVFSLADEPVFSDGEFNPPEQTDTSQPPSPRLVWEMPYREARQMIGDSDLASALSADPDAGFIQAAAVRPATGVSINAEMQVDDGTGYVFADMLEFAPGGLLETAIGPTNTAITLAADADLSGATVGMLAAIEDEVVRIDAIAGNVLTIARGCLDTVPRAHAAGAGVVIFDDFSMTDSEVYTAADNAGVKLLTIGTSGMLELADAPADAITFNSRVIRPYPVGNFRVDNSYAPASVTMTGMLSWAHRDRIGQTSIVEHGNSANFGPEAGVTYRVDIYGVDQNGGLIEPASVSVNVGTDTSYAFDFNVTPPSPAAVSALFTVVAVRDGYENWQAPTITALLPEHPGAILLAGDQQTGTDRLLLAGDAQTGSDAEQHIRS